jgi:hypothetical protein
MSHEVPKCKITVLKRLLNQDLVEEYLDVEGEFVACERFSDGEEFMVEQAFQMPEGFALGLGRICAATSWRCSPAGTCPG